MDITDLLIKLCSEVHIFRADALTVRGRQRNNSDYLGLMVILVLNYNSVMQAAKFSSNTKAKINTYHVSSLVTDNAARIKVFLLFDVFRKLFQPIRDQIGLF